MNEITNSERKPDGTFGQGQSGNPAGRKPGAPNKKTLEVREVLSALSPLLFSKLHELLRQGDPAVIKILADRILPRRRLISIELPQTDTLRGCAEAQQIITTMLAAGNLDPQEAASLSAVLDRQASALERMDLEVRISTLEALQAELD